MKGSVCTFAERVNAANLAPAAVDQQLGRLVLDLVPHLGRLGDPEAEVEVGQAAAAALLHLLENREHAEAAGGQVGVEERVDGGQSVVEGVGHGGRHQPAVEPDVQEEGPGPTRPEHREQLPGRRRVHPALGVTAADVAGVEIQAGPVGRRRLRAHDEIGVPLQHPPEAPSPAEPLHRDAGGHARLARLAARAIQVVPGPPEPGAREIGVRGG